MVKVGGGVTNASNKLFLIIPDAQISLFLRGFWHIPAVGIKLLQIAFSYGAASVIFCFVLFYVFQLYSNCT